MHLKWSNRDRSCALNSYFLNLIIIYRPPTDHITTDHLLTTYQPLFYSTACSILPEEYLSWFLCSFHDQDGIQSAFWGKRRSFLKLILMLTWSSLMPFVDEAFNLSPTAVWLALKGIFGSCKENDTLTLTF